MAKNKTMYDFCNFFLNINKVNFYLSLGDLKLKKLKFYNLCRDSKISAHHGDLILSGLRDNKLITYEYNSQLFSYVVEYTVRGKRLKDILLRVKSFMEKYEVWC